MSKQVMHFCEKLLPNQEPYKSDFVGSSDEHMQKLFEVIMQSSAIEMPEDRFDLVQSEKFTIPEMGSNPISLRFLEMLTLLTRSKNVLEIGTFIGVSAMNFAAALPKDGKVVTFEKFDHFADIAQTNFDKNGFSDQIQLIVGDASEELDQIPQGMKFDLIFIDGNKEKYLNYFQDLEGHLSDNGMVLVDDCFFHGDALNDEPTNEKGLGCKKFLDEAATLDKYHRLALPISNGIYILIKK